MLKTINKHSIQHLSLIPYAPPSKIGYFPSFKVLLVNAHKKLIRFIQNQKIQPIFAHYFKIKCLLKCHFTVEVLLNNQYIFAVNKHHTNYSKSKNKIPIFGWKLELEMIYVQQPCPNNY